LLAAQRWEFRRLIAAAGRAVPVPAMEVDEIFAGVSARTVTAMMFPP
jgi:hypothetical protein